MKRIVVTTGVWLAVFAWGTAMRSGAFQDARAPTQPRLPAWMAQFLPGTPEEKARAAFFDQRGRELLRPGFSMVSIACGALAGDVPRPVYYSFAADVVCSHDAAVVGTPTPVIVRLNNRGTYLFTEHRVSVARWLYSSGEPAAEIDVLTAGGKLDVGGQRVEVSETPSPELRAGNEYLILLKRVPGTTAFVPMITLREGASWTRGFGTMHLPHELHDQDVPFDRFVDDLTLVAGSCRRSAR